MKPSELTDDVSLIGATRNGNSLPVYDDGYGKLFIHHGDCLDELTDALASELGIELQGEPNE